MVRHLRKERTKTSLHIGMYVRIVLILVICHSFFTTVSAQETSWNELTVEVLTLCQQGKYQDALKVAQRALQVAKETFGPNDPKVATSMNNLATVYRIQGNYIEAESLYKQALTAKELALGPNHPKVATSLNNLAGSVPGPGQIRRSRGALQTGAEHKTKRLGARPSGCWAISKQLGITL